MLLPAHLFPPCLADVASVLRLSWDPPPQDLEHFDHPPQEDHLQCTKKIYEIDLHQMIMFAISPQKIP